MARVLVIDDEEDVRRVVDVMLKNAGHDAVLAVDGHDALQQFEQQRFDLVICDLFMPNKEGIATLRELRRRDFAVPAIMMSSGMPSASYLGLAHVDYLAMAKSAGRYSDNREAIQILAAHQASARVPGGRLAAGTPPRRCSAPGLLRQGP